MRRLAGRSALLLGLLGTVAGPAHAAAPWTTPRDVTAPAGYVDATRPESVGSGRFVLTWALRSGGPVPSCRTGARTKVATLTRDRRVSTAVDVPGRAVAQPVALPAGAVLLTQAVDARAGAGCRTRISLYALSPLRRYLGRSLLEPGATAVRTAPGRDGTVVVAYAIQRVGSDDTRIVSIRVLVRRRGGRLTAPRTVATIPGTFEDGLDALALATAADGRTVLAYAQDACRPVPGRRSCRIVRDVRAAIAAPGRRLGAFRRLGPSEGFSSLDAAVTARGGAVVLWGSQDTGEEANRPWRVRVAQADATGRFGPVRLLDPGDTAERPSGGVRVEPLPDGRAVAAWSGIVGDRYPVRAAVLGPDDGPADVREVLPSGHVGGLAVAPDATATLLMGRVVTGTFGQQTDAILAARLEPLFSVFGVPETVVEGEPARTVGVALDPRDGAAVAAWTGRPGGPPDSTGVTATERLRLSFRR